MHTVVYDDECPLCTFQMQLLTWLDWRHVLRFAPLTRAELPPQAQHLTPEALSEAVHCVAEDGRIYRGARAIRFVGWRLPLLIPVAAFLSLPGVIWVAERVYMFISRNRQLLSKLFGCKGACRILPARERTAETTQP